MLPEAISCSLGFQTWVRLRSISVTSACLRRPSVSPSRVASSSPPAPPPTMTMRWLMGFRRSAAVLICERRCEIAARTAVCAPPEPASQRPAPACAPRPASSTASGSSASASVSLLSCLCMRFMSTSPVHLPTTTVATPLPIRLVSARASRHEAVDAQDQRQPGHRHAADRDERRGQHDEAAAGDAGRALGGEQQHGEQASAAASASAACWWPGR